MIETLLSHDQHAPDKIRNTPVDSSGYPAPRWWEQFEDDGDGETYWDAASPYCYDDEGDPICWRLKARIENGRFEWYEAHDAELMTGQPEAWPTLEEAKAAIAVKHAEIAKVEGLAG